MRHIKTKIAINKKVLDVELNIDEYIVTINYIDEKGSYKNLYYCIVEVLERSKKMLSGLIRYIYAVSSLSFLFLSLWVVVFVTTEDFKKSLIWLILFIFSIIS